jgi:DNA damage-binding protein 1
MEDGNVVTYNVDRTNFGLSGRKTVILGTQQARLHVLPGEGIVTRVFATTENSSLIHSSEGRVVFSAATAEDAIYVAPFDCEAYPNSIVIANDSQLRISSLDTERRTQVKAFPLGRTVRRLAYSPTLKAFVLGCIKRALSAGEEIITTQLFLVDEVVFQALGSPFVLKPVSGVELPECIVRAELPDSQGNIAERFVVGTSISADPTTGQSPLIRGRILVLGVDSDRRLYQVLSHPLNGACKSIGVTADGTIVAALSATLIAYRYVELSSTKARLENRGKVRVATHPQQMSFSGNLIGMLDVVKSLTVVEFVDGEEKPEKRFVEREVHMESSWPTAVGHIGSGSWLEAGAAGNLLVLRKKDGDTRREGARMEVVNALNLGEQVNQIRPLNIAPSNKDVISPRAFLATVRCTSIPFSSLFSFSFTLRKVLLTTCISAQL